MNGALGYLALRSAVGRVRARLARLKKPKYLLGAILGLLYIYHFFLRRVEAPEVGALGGTKVLDGVVQGGALLFLLVVCVQWVSVFRCGGLRLTESELEILFAAPVTRRDLIHYHLLKSQVGLLISTGMLSFFAHRVFPHQSYLRFWLILYAVFIFFYFEQTFLDLLALVPVNRWLNRLGQILVGLLSLASGIVGVVVDDPRDFPGFQNALAKGFGLLTSPVRLVAKGLVLPGLLPVAEASMVLAGMIALLYFGIGVLKVDPVQLEERTIARQRQRLRRQNKLAGAKTLDVEKASGDLSRWLGTTGSAVRVLIGKSLIGFRRYATRMPFTILAPLFLTTSGVTIVVGLHTGEKSLAFVPLFLCGVLMLIGGRLLHLDFRAELVHVELLRSFPVSGWQMVVAVLGVNALLVGTVQLLLSSMFMLSASMTHTVVIGYSPLAIGLAAILVLPLTSAFFFLLENLLILWLPGWFMDEPGEVRSRGFDVMGRRMLNLLVRLVGLLVFGLPALLVGGLLVFFVKGNTGILLGASAFALIVLVELAPVVWLSGLLFDRIESFGDEAL